MTEQESFYRIRRALISVSDKTGIIALAKTLKELEVEIISTGGTATYLREAGLEVLDVADLTGFPEMMDGRIKTLHPRVHGGLLSIRDNADHLAAMHEHGIKPIDLVVVNLYPFEQTVARPNVAFAEAIEQIDIGGPAMIRSAAKNQKSVTVVVSPEDYEEVAAELQKNRGATSTGLRRKLALKAFQRTAVYDATISAYLMKIEAGAPRGSASISAGAGGFYSAAAGGAEPVISIETATRPPTMAQWTLRKKADLRYGENPHQQAAIYQTGSQFGVGAAELLSGKEMSYNNYLDSDAAWQLVCDFAETTCAIIKHTNPAGVGQGESVVQAYRKARETDPISAFGGIVACNRTIDYSAAQAIIEIFTEVVIAPDYLPDALEILKTKKNLRVLRAGQTTLPPGLEFRHIGGGILAQTRDTLVLNESDLKVVTKRAPTAQEMRALRFAWIVCKHTKSNAIVYATEGQTVGVGAGQMSRVDSVKLGAQRARLPIAGSVLASDAFFPFRDGLDEAAKYGVVAVIQPGGSIKDAEVIAAADEYGLAMVFTGVRHFKH